MSDPNAPRSIQANPNTPSSDVIREFPDRGTQWLLEDPIHLRDLLQLLQPELAERLDASRAQRINRTMIPPDLQKQESDVIFLIPYRADREEERGERQETDQTVREWEVLIYVLLEHQSQHDPLMALRLLLYMVELWSEQRRVAEAANVPKGQIRIYPVIPMVFYTDAGEWTTPLDLMHLMALPEELRRFVPQWDVLFLNLHQTPPETLTQFATAVGYALRVMQAEQRPLAALSGLEGLSEAQAGQWQWMAWFILLLAYHRRERPEYDILQVDILATTRASKFAERTGVEQMAQSMAQYVAEQARQEGIEIGQVQTLRRVLLSFLTARFGELPPALTQTIEGAATEQLERWVSVAATAETLEAVGIETQH